jgi:hypothetical protein
MRIPPPEIKTHLWAAANQHGVPYTLLAAIAYRESQYNPEAVSPPNNKGQIDRGLFQLSPGTIEGYGVANPLDAGESTRAAARMLQHLGRATGWNWAHMLWAYNYGPTAVARLLNDGKTPPLEVQRYAESVIGNRRWLQAQESAQGSAVPDMSKQQSFRYGDGSTAVQRLDRAIQALARLNPNVEQIAQLQYAWGSWYTPERRKIGDAALVEQPFLVTSWNTYARAYDRAPLTSSDTPTPAYIEPELWERVREKASTALAYVVDATNQAKAVAARALTWWEGGGDEQSTWLALGGVGLLLWMLRRRGRGRTKAGALL